MSDQFTHRLLERINKLEDENKHLKKINEELRDENETLSIDILTLNNTLINSGCKKKRLLSGREIYCKKSKLLRCLVL